MLDLKTSCRALSASERWTKTICRVPQPMRNCHESHVNKLLFKHGGDRLGPKTKRGLSRQKNLQLYDKKSAKCTATLNFVLSASLPVLVKHCLTENLKKPNALVRPRPIRSRLYPRLLYDAFTPSVYTTTMECK